MATIAVLGTLDSKGLEHAFLADLIRKRGHEVLLIDVGVMGAAGVEVNYSCEQVAQAGGVDLAALSLKRDRGECVAAMARAAPIFLSQLHADGQIDGVISLGGGGGTSIATAAMRALPIGFPKLMVSTLASGNVAPYLGTKDIAMMPSIVDVAGLNRISKMVFARAAGSICGMVESEVTAGEDRPIIAASMFGNTTDCVNAAIPILEDAGYEVLVFHATGTGGRAMEDLIQSGMVAGVLDITTTEWADELVGGVLSAGPQRLDATAVAQIPSIVVPGCLDMVNFGAPDSVPAEFESRTFYHHNPQVTLMRTDVEECSKLGHILAEKINTYTSPVTVLLPLQAMSVISAPGQAFHHAEADAALYQTLTSELNPNIEVISMECEINAPAFSRACAEALLSNLEKSSKPCHS